jgi:hypothetical protein
LRFADLDATTPNLLAQFAQSDALGAEGLSDLEVATIVQQLASKDVKQPKLISYEAVAGKDVSLIT